MANRRKRKPKAKASESKGVRVALPREATAVICASAGVLTLLSLFSYHPRDTSLNASGAFGLHNWIGPAGAYWSDLLFQSLGVGAYALGFGLVLAGIRAMAGRRVRPGWREALGIAFLVVFVGSLAHLLVHGVQRPYPAGGVAGAILGELLLENFAVIGGYVVSTTLVLVALTLTVDGVLAGLGLRGVGLLYSACTHLLAWGVQQWERHKAYREARREARAEEFEADEAENEDAVGWSFDSEVLEARREKRERKLKRARIKGREAGEHKASRERSRGGDEERKSRRDDSMPRVGLDDTIDLAAEHEFEFGLNHDFGGESANIDQPYFDENITIPPLPEEVDDEPASPQLSSAKKEDDVAIRAASPEFARDAENKAPARAAEEGKQETKPTAPITPPKPPSQPQAKESQKPKATAGLDGPEIVDARPKVDADAIARASDAVVDDMLQTFVPPPVSLLDFKGHEEVPIDPIKLREKADRLTQTLQHYGIEGRVREIRPGPVVTMYEYVPAPGTKVARIASLADDLAMSMEALRVRIVAPIPGKGAVGIEIPNATRETVFFKEIVSHNTFRASKSHLTVALGKDIEGNACTANLAAMPHLLVAGATGAGKSVSINSMIMSILYKSTPDQVRMIMVDPKMLELSVYEGIPHLLLPVVTDPKKAALALRWAVEEMERRYKLLSTLGVRSIDGYNQKLRALIDKGQTPFYENKHGEEEACEPIPYIVVIVDELADLMMVAAREVEASIMRLAQMARAAGIHLILATQRPSVDVITGVIKANFPTRIAFQVASKHDSRTILDANGAEHLLGRGDMLHLSAGAGGIRRVHGAYVSEDEIERVVNFLKDQGNPEYDESILAAREEADAATPDESEKDEMYDLAVSIVAETQQASISMIQRRLRIGYNRAARMVEQMEAEGVVGPADGSKPREVLISPAAA